MPILKKVNLYSTNDLKANIDENLFSVFESLGYIEDFKLIDIRLSLGVICCLIAGGTFYYDKQSNFKDSVNLISLAVLIYFILSWILWIWTKFVEKNIKFVGVKKSSNEKLILKSSVKKFDEFYKFELSINNKKISGEISFSKLFNENGFLDYQELKDFFTKEVEKISKKSN